MTNKEKNMSSVILECYEATNSILWFITSEASWELHWKKQVGCFNHGVVSDCLMLLGVRMRMMPHAAPCQCVCAHAHVDGPCGAGVTNSLVQTQEGLLESNLKLSVFIPGLWRLSTTCFVLLHFLLFSSCRLGFFCTLASSLSLSQCRQLSAAFSTRFHKTLCCG